MNTPNDMLVFLAVADSGSFTAAAELLKTPKSNISRKLSRLEDELNIRLLERTTRSLSLTEAGRIYLEHCRRVKEEIDGASLSLETLTSQPSGTLRIGTTVTIGQNILAPHLLAFQTAFPLVQLDIQLTNRRIDLIEESIDVVFRVGPSVDSSLISKRLCSLSLNLYASADYLNQHAELTQPSQLYKHDCLFMNGQGGEPNWPLKNEENSQIGIKPTLQCNDFNILHQACVNHRGIALLPEYMCLTDIKEKRLQPVLPEQIGRDVDIFILYPSRKGKLPKLTAMIEFMTNQLSAT